MISKVDFRKKVNIITLIAICVLFMLSFICLSHGATKTVGTFAFQMSRFIAVKGSIKNLVHQTVSGNGTWHDIYTYFCSTSKTIVNRYQAGNVTYTTVSVHQDAFSAAFNAFMLAGKVVGAIWLIILVAGDIIKNLSNENLEVHDAVFKPLITLIIAILLIINADRITGIVFNLAGYLNEEAGKVAITFGDPSSSNKITAPTWLKNALPEDEKDKADTIYTFLVAAMDGDSVGEKVGFFEKTGMIFNLLIPWLGAVASYGFGVFLILQLMFEIGIRRALIPLAMVWIYQDGIRSPGVRYIRQLFACVLQLAMFVIIANVSESLQSLLMMGESGLMQTATLLIANFSALGIMSKSKEFINAAVSG